MSYTPLCYKLLKQFDSILKHRNTFNRCIRAGFTTLNENVQNYYDIQDKRNLAESSAFDSNDFRKNWTNRDDSTNEDFLDTHDHINPIRKSVPIYRTCKITNYRSKTNVPVNSMEGPDLVSGISYSMLGIENDMDLESLYNYLQNPNFSKLNRSLELLKDKVQLMTEFQIQVEKLLHHQLLKMEDTIKILLLFDRLGFLSQDLMNIFQSNMLLNIHKFSPFQVITTFEIFRKQRKNYENFLNVLCLIFYDHMIPSLKSSTSGDSNIETRYVLQFLKVLKDFKFKRLTDVLYAQVYDKLDMLSKEDMVQVSNTFFKNKKDTNFVELYTRILSSVFKIPLLDLYKFEEYALENLENSNSSSTNKTTTNNNNTIITGNSRDVDVDDLSVLKSIFNCTSEFLLSSVHHRIEFKRLWRYNIKTNNVSWKVESMNTDTSTKYITNTNNNIHNNNNTSNNVNKSGSVVVDTDNKLDDNSLEKQANSNYCTDVSIPKQMYSYLVNFPELHERIEKIILKGFKFQNYSCSFVCNIISTVLDYSRYSDNTTDRSNTDSNSSSTNKTTTNNNNSNTKNILSNLYAMLLTLTTSERTGVNSYSIYLENIENLRLISPKTLMDNNHVYFYKIDPNFEFYKIKEVNYYKPHLTIKSLFNGDYSLYSLLIESFSNIIENIDNSKLDFREEEQLNNNNNNNICTLVRNVLHPLYCSIRGSTKPFLVIDLLHMNGRLNERDQLDVDKENDLYKLIEDCSKNTKMLLLEKGTGLSNSINSFVEKVNKYISRFLKCDKFTLRERLEILRTISTMKICNPEFEYKDTVEEYINTTVKGFIEYFGTKHKEDLEDRFMVGDDIKLFDCINDLLVYQNQDSNTNSLLYYELLREILKAIYSRINYYSVPELIMLSSCISSSLMYFGKLDLESEEILENLNLTLRLLREETIKVFELKSKIEEEFNLESKGVYDLLMMYH